MLDIPANLLHQLFRRGEFDFIPQMLHQFYGEVLTVDVLVKIQDEYLYAALSFAKGRPFTDISHRLIYLIPDMSQSSIDTIVRQRLLRIHIYISRGKTKLVPPLHTTHHRAAQFEVPAQQLVH